MNISKSLFKKPEPAKSVTASAGLPREGDALRMEFSTFAQGWLTHLSPADGERLLKLYGLSAAYDELQPREVTHRHCCGCGSDLQTLPGAHKVVCESCGHTLDMDSEEVPCQKCGASFSFPVAVNHVLCPYCKTDTRRI